MKIIKQNSILVEQFGAKIKVLSPIRWGKAKVKILEVGEMLEGVRKGQTVDGFAVTFGVLRFHLADE